MPQSPFSDAAPIEEALKTYDKSQFNDLYAEAEKARLAVVERFPLDAWPQMTLEQYALGQADSEDTYCKWLEYRTRVIGSIKGGSARKHIIYKYKDKPGWYYPKEKYADKKEAWEAIRAGYVEALARAADADWDSIDGIAALEGGPAIKVKTLHIYFPDEILPISSREHLQHFYRKIGGGDAQARAYDVVQLNRALLAKARELPGFSGWTTKQIEHFMYNWAHPREARRVVKISPGDGGCYWSECLAENYVCVGWDNVGDLSLFESKDDFYESFERHYSELYKGRLQTIRRKANELWTLRELEPGDTVVANRGISHVLALGRVDDPAYEWRPERGDYRHTVNVVWDTSFARDIEPQKRWGMVTVVAVANALYEQLVAGRKMSAAPVDPVFTQLAEALERKGQAILYGPPGTGKTHIGRRFAVWWLQRRLRQEPVGFDQAEPMLSTVQVARRVWWIVANPREWTWSELFRTGEVDFRYGRLKRNYAKVQKGDLVIGYQSSPDKRIVALAEVHRGLHPNAEGEQKLTLKPLKAVENGLTYDQMKADKLLAETEPMRFNCQGTLFALTERESEWLLAALSEQKRFLSGSHAHLDLAAHHFHILLDSSLHRLVERSIIANVTRKLACLTSARKGQGVCRQIGQWRDPRFASRQVIPGCLGIQANRANQPEAGNKDSCAVWSGVGHLWFWAKWNGSGSA